MNYQINFPHLGIYLEHVGKSISVGGFAIAYYGIAIAVGMLLGIGLVCRRAKETGQDPDSYVDICVHTMIIGVIGARIYYVIFSWSAYKDDLLSILNLRQGGLAIYGGIIAGIATLIAAARRRKLPVGKVLDTCIIGLPLGQILGRWGNFFNREAFGAYTDGLFAMQLPVSAVRQHEITEEMWAHLQNIGGADFIQVHPTFLYEGMWNTCVLLFLLLVRNKTRFEGELILLYIAGYGIGRFFIEQLRTDQLLIPGTAVPVSMVLSGAAAVLSVLAVLLLRKRAEAPSKKE